MTHASRWHVVVAIMTALPLLAGLRVLSAFGHAADGRSLLRRWVSCARTHTRTHARTHARMHVRITHARAHTWRVLCLGRRFGGRCSLHFELFRRGTFSHDCAEN